MWKQFHRSGFPQYYILFNDHLWNSDDLSETKQYFLKKFGELFAEHACLRSMDESQIDIRKPFTEAEFGTLAQDLNIFAILMKLLDEGKIAALVSSTGELKWAKIGQ